MLIESRANGVVEENPTEPVKLLVFENVLKSARRVDDAAVAEDVSIHTKPLAFVLRVPTVVVDNVRKPAWRLVVLAVTNDE